MYNYQEAVKQDIRDYINEEYTKEELREKLEDREQFENDLNDDLWITDSVTGNASGSYTFNRWTAREYVIENIDLLSEVIHEFCIESETVRENLLDEEWEYFDVAIRCYLLHSTVSEVLDELEQEI